MFLQLQSGASRTGMRLDTKLTRIVLSVQAVRTTGAGPPPRHMAIAKNRGNMRLEGRGGGVCAAWAVAVEGGGIAGTWVLLQAI